MDKKKKIIMIAIVVLIIVLLVVGIISFVTYDKGLPDTNNEFEYVELDEETDPIGYEIYYSTYDEVISYLNTMVLDSPNVAQLESENGDCWTFITTNNERYSYCQGDSEVLKIE